MGKHRGTEVEKNRTPERPQRGLERKSVVLKITGLNSEANVALCGPQIRGETGGLPALVRE